MTSSTQIVPRELGDVGVEFDPDFHVLKRIARFRAEWPIDPPNHVRHDKRIGHGKSPFRYDARPYFVHSKRLPKGVMVPGMVMITLDEHEKPVEGEFQACISDAQITELRDHLDGQRTITMGEHRADRMAKELRVQELAKYGERITTASEEERFGRALAQIDDPIVRKAALAAYLAQEDGVAVAPLPAEATDETRLMDALTLFEDPDVKRAAIESYMKKTGLKRGPGRPPGKATKKTTEKVETPA